MNDLDYIIVITNVFNLFILLTILFSPYVCAISFEREHKHIFTSYLLTAKENTVANNNN